MTGGGAMALTVITKACCYRVYGVCGISWRDDLAMRREEPCPRWARA